MKKNRTLAGILAIFLGTIGIHHFYMGNVKKGLVYLVLFWTGIPTILGFLDGAAYLVEEGEEPDRKPAKKSPVKSEKKPAAKSAKNMKDRIKAKAEEDKNEEKK